METRVTIRATELSVTDREVLAEELGLIAIEAGHLLASVADRNTGHRVKEDGSPSTDADALAERLILDRLGQLWPTIPVVAEESGLCGIAGESFFLVDPLDGTRDYVAGYPEYAVNIAFVQGTRPVAAALAAPGLHRIWIAGTATRVARTDASGPLRWAAAKARRAREGGIVALGSRRHGDPDTEACLAMIAPNEIRTASSALKFGLIASGEADIYVRCGATMEWDTAAGDHIVACAGGVVIGPGGEGLTYGHAERGYLNGSFAALGDPSLADRIALPRPTP